MDRLGETRHRLMTAIEQARECISITDAQGAILYVNAAFAQTTGYGPDRAIGQTHRILKSGKHEAAFYQDMWATITAGQAWHGRIVNRRKDGGFYTSDAVVTPVRDESGRIVNYIAAARDITRELQLEEQFLRAQKMEAVGQLAGGVAHDFNNIIGAILLHLNLMGLDPGLADKLRAELKELEGECGRAASLTRSCRCSAASRPCRSKTVNLTQLLEGLLKMLRRLLGERVEIILPGAGAAVWVEADPGMIEQVAMNLCVNARDAMPRGGRLTITTEVVEVDAAAAKENAKGGKYACLAVADTGEGMDAATMQRIFEPFFTTKEAGKGTGLGLATVYGIAKQHHGWVEVDSEVGRGSVFRVYLPVTDQIVAPRAAALGFDGTRGTETVLLVEDEKNVRQMAAQCLREFGYQVEEAVDGVQALELWEQHKPEIALLLIDMMLPGRTTGLEIAQQFKRTKDTLKVIIMSGYTENVLQLEGAMAREQMTYLTKPFDIRELLKIIRRNLDANSRAGRRAARRSSAFPARRFPV